MRRQVATPFMVIDNDFDSRTPLRAARSLAHALGMERHVVRYAGSTVSAATVVRVPGFRREFPKIRT